MSELLKKQNYGVEVEFTGISRKMAADAVAEIIGTTASRPDHTCYQTRTIQDSQGRKWKVMRDSSINPIRKAGTENMDEYRVEFVTPVLKYEDLDTLQAIFFHVFWPQQPSSSMPTFFWNVLSAAGTGVPSWYSFQNLHQQQLRVLPAGNTLPNLLLQTAALEVECLFFQSG